MKKCINYIVLSSDLENAPAIQELRQNALSSYVFKDARSAVYGATGIAAQNNELVVVCVNGSNASRSAFSGMTEAFYRKLPIVLMTIGETLDYREELNDVTFGHYKVKSLTELEPLLEQELPIHIELLLDVISTEKVGANCIFDVLCCILDAKDYLYVSSNIDVVGRKNGCKMVFGGMPNCYEGALANVLGASLAKKHNRYIAIVTEEEFLHDMNTLGNINMSDSVMYIVMSPTPNNVIYHYAKASRFEVGIMSRSGVSQQEIESYIRNNKRTVLIVHGE